MRLWRYHKPRGLASSPRAPAGTETIFAHLPAGLPPGLVGIGRIDRSEFGPAPLSERYEGLVMLTDEPRMNGIWRQWPRVFRLRIYSPDEIDWTTLAERLPYRWGSQNGRNIWLDVGPTLDNPRHAIEAAGGVVNRAIALTHGPFELGDLAVGAAAAVPQDQVPVVPPELLMNKYERRVLKLEQRLAAGTDVHDAAGLERVLDAARELARGHAAACAAKQVDEVPE